MAVSKVVEISAFQVASRRMALITASAFFLATVQAQAQQAQIAQDGRVIVTGEGDVAVAPDHAQITGGVTTRAKSVKEATDANSKVMAAVTAALLEVGIEQKDIQTSRFSIQPVYAPQGPSTEPKFSGYSGSNQVRVKIRQIDKVGEILDRLVAAGGTDLGNIAFL
ncbi:MAG: SIMPL domain-containing protein, partial [Hyphomicrobiales bacterium]|nr:SIMPL domain-containing protein [Hyphomicrobiales bacterium]